MGGPRRRRSEPIEATRAVADAVLYEGYVLYPYRATSSKNVVRWQWGVLMPPDVVALDDSERVSNRTGLVIDGDMTKDDRTLRATVRFLQVQRRYVENAAGERVDRLEVGDATYLPWDEAVEQEVVVDVPLDRPSDLTHEVPGGSEVEELDGGRLVRRREPVAVGITTSAEQPVSPYPVSLVTFTVENRTATGEPGARGPHWLRRSLVACHILFEVEGAAFLSQLDPPEWAKGFVAACDNDGVFPVLGGPVDEAGTC